MIRQAITTALKGALQPLGGADVAMRAGLPYKVAIDALGRMLDAGTVVRFGRKYSAQWALAATAAALPRDGIGALEAVWRSATPTPRGGEGKATPAMRM